MDAQLKSKWIEALRSGEYRQTESALHDTSTDSYCCLGVLCKVMGAEFADVITGDFDVLSHVPVLDGRVLADADEEMLKGVVCEELGIPDQSELTSRNDGVLREGDPLYVRKHTFAEIADYIETNL